MAKLWMREYTFLINLNREHCTPSISMIYLQIDRCLQMYLCIWQWQPNEADVFFLSCFDAAALSVILQLVHWATKTQGLEMGLRGTWVTDWLLTSAQHLASCLHCVCPSSNPSQIVRVWHSFPQSLSQCGHKICFDLAWLLLFPCCFLWPQKRRHGS